MEKDLNSTAGAQTTDYESRSLQIGVFGVKLDITMPEDVYPIFERKYRAVLPQASGTRSDAECNVRITATHGPPLLRIDNGNVVMSSFANSSQFAIDVMLAASKFLERELNKNGIYSFHASAISHNGVGMIFLGQPGAGKTTTALSVCFLNKEVQLVSGSRCFVKEDKIVGSIPGLDLRLGSVMEELSSELKGVTAALNLDNVRAWDQRVVIKPDEAGITLNSKYPIDIGSFVLVKKLPKNLTVITEGIERDAFLARIYDSIYTFSEQLPHYVLGSKIPYPDIFGEAMRLKRMGFGEQVLAGKPTIYLEGRLADMSSYIVKNVLRA